MLENLVLLRADEVRYNTRVKGYYDEVGNYVPYEVMTCSRPIFGSGLEVSDYTKSVEHQLAYRAANEELFGHNHGYNNKGYVPKKSSRDDLIDSARRRARRKIFDYCICNRFDYFVTLTLDSKMIDRSDYGAVVKKLNNFLGNRVRRHGLKYIGVPELHKNGGLHFHFAMTGGGFRLVDSGTVSVDGRKRPIKKSTADRLKIPLEQRHTVYNIVDWKLGFSTAIRTYGERGALATYLSKELCKDVQKNNKRGIVDKIGGRWYLHGGDLCSPVCRLDNRDFRSASGESYDISTDGGDFKVWKLDSQGQVL